MPPELPRTAARPESLLHIEYARPVAVDDALAILMGHGWRDVQLLAHLDGTRTLRRCMVEPPNGG